MKATGEKFVGVDGFGAVGGGAEKRDFGKFAADFDGHGVFSVMRGA